MENVRVRRAGYAFRQNFEQFLYRYKMLSPMTWPSWSNHPQDGVQEIFYALRIPNEEYTCGTTKIFIRNPRTVSIAIWNKIMILRRQIGTSSSQF